MKIIIILLITLCSYTSVAKPKPIEASPVPVLVQRLSFEELVDLADKQLNQLQTNLDKALVKIKATQKELVNANNDLDEANNKSIELQKQIDEETTLFNSAREELNKQIKVVDDLKAKIKVLSDKLAFWHKLVGILAGLVTVYGVFLVLKVMGKL